VAAVAPTSAMTCCAESTPSPRNFRDALHRVVMVSEELGHLVIEPAEVILE
jgi:hypothetical protein